jgi:hypothetical protein
MTASAYYDYGYPGYGYDYPGYDYGYPGYGHGYGYGRGHRYRPYGHGPLRYGYGRRHLGGPYRHGYGYGYGYAEPPAAAEADETKEAKVEEKKAGKPSTMTPYDFHQARRQMHRGYYGGYRRPGAYRYGYGRHYGPGRYGHSYGRWGGYDYPSYGYPMGPGAMMAPPAAPEAATTESSE